MGSSQDPGPVSSCSSGVQCLTPRCSPQVTFQRACIEAHNNCRNEEDGSSDLGLLLGIRAPSAERSSESDGEEENPAGGRSGAGQGRRVAVQSSLLVGAQFNHQVLGHQRCVHRQQGSAREGEGTRVRFVEESVCTDEHSRSTRGSTEERFRACDLSRCSQSKVSAATEEGPTTFGTSPLSLLPQGLEVPPTVDFGTRREESLLHLPERAQCLQEAGLQFPPCLRELRKWQFDG